MFKRRLKHTEAFDLRLSLEDSFRASQLAAAALNWKVTEQSKAEGRLLCDQVTSWTEPARVEISLHTNPSVPLLTRVVMEGSMRGFGPLVRQLLSGEMGKLRSRIELKAMENTATAAQKPGGLVSEVERLADLHTRGVLTDEEFARAKERLLSE